MNIGVWPAHLDITSWYTMGRRGLTRGPEMGDQDWLREGGLQ